MFYLLLITGEYQRRGSHAKHPNRLMHILYSTYSEVLNWVSKGKLQSHESSCLRAEFELLLTKEKAFSSDSTVSLNITRNWSSKKHLFLLQLLSKSYEYLFVFIHYSSLLTQEPNKKSTEQENLDDTCLTPSVVNIVFHKSPFVYAS